MVFRYDLSWGNKEIRFFLAGQEAVVKGSDINLFLWKLKAPIHVALHLQHLIVGNHARFRVGDKGDLTIKREK